MAENTEALFRESAEVMSRRPGFKEWDFRGHQEFDNARDGFEQLDGTYCLNATYTMIILIDGLWHEIWCPLCGANAIMHPSGVRFFANCSAMVKHIKNDHEMLHVGIMSRDETEIADKDYVLKHCGRSALIEEDLETLGTGFIVPEQVLKHGERA